MVNVDSDTGIDFFFAWPITWTKVDASLRRHMVSLDHKIMA